VADFTRNSFQPLKHFSQVLMQQGRVQLDADWNEQGAILLHYVRRLVAEAFPQGFGHGFGLSPLATQTAVTDDFAIGAGSYFVGGLLCELEGTPTAVLQTSVDNDRRRIKVAAWTLDGVPFTVGQYVEITNTATSPPVPLGTAKIVALDYSTTTLTLDRDVVPPANATLIARRVVTFRSQPDPTEQLRLPSGDPAPLPTGKSQVYLDVWERIITPLEDDSIREVALDGADTAVRKRVVWQVRTAPYLLEAVRAPNPSTGGGQNVAGGGATLTNGGQDNGPVACMMPQALEKLHRPLPAGLLRARTEPSQVSTDPCTISPESHFRGAQNQLYRVEIHTGSGNDAAPPTFKWSRENDSVKFAIAGPPSGGGGVATVTLADLGRDERFGLALGDWVEIRDDRMVLTNTVMPLLQVQSVDRMRSTVTLAGNVPAGIDLSMHPVLHRWDQKATDPAEGGSDLAADGTVPIAAGTWITLEDGVQVQFPAVDGVWFRPGDYWQIAARVTIGDVLWPNESGRDANGNTIVNPIAQPPHGVQHYYAPLGVLTVDGGNAPHFNRCAAVAS
jgi:hypothetical protein